MATLRVIFTGSGAFGAPTLKGLLESSECQVVQVVTQPQRPAGRGLKLSPTSIAQLAAEHGSPILETANLNSEKLPEADVMVVIAFGQKIAPNIVNHPRLGSINLHASLLPKYRGAAPINRAILRGESVSGNSVIRLASRMDAGAILCQSQLPIGELETAGELHDRLAIDGVSLVLQTLESLQEGTATEVPQDDAQATVAPKLKREDAAIDWQCGAQSIACRIRGMHPWPACHVGVFEGERQVVRATLVRARPGSEPAGGPPGTILPSHLIATGDGTLEIVELQPEGKRPMSLSAYRNGHAWDAGMRLESTLLK